MLKGAHVAASAGATGVSLDDRLPEHHTFPPHLPEHHIFPAPHFLRVKVRSPCFSAIPVELVHVLQQVPTWCWVLRPGMTARQRCHWDVRVDAPRRDPLSLQCCCHALVLDQPADHLGRKSELKDQPHSPSTAASSSPERAWTPHATPGNARRSARHTVSGLSNGCLNICAPRRVASRTPGERMQKNKRNPCSGQKFTMHNLEEKKSNACLILHFLHALDDIYSFPIVFPDFTVLQNSLTSRATDMMVFGILGGLNPSFLWHE